VTSDPHPAGQVDPDRGVYGITVAAELAGSAPQNLRLYEARGLVQPDRSPGGTRRYSANDLERVREITRLLGDGLNLAGIASVLELQAANRALQAELDDARRASGDTPPSTAPGPERGLIRHISDMGRAPRVGKPRAFERMAMTTTPPNPRPDDPDPAPFPRREPIPPIEPSRPAMAD
jgi:MerR family transcriptional regulator, heat shock protein HspR